MTYQLGVIPRFPARVVAGVGIRIDRANAVYTFSTDYSTVAPGSVADPANTDVLVQLPDGTYATVPVSAIAASTLPVQQTGKRNALINGGFGVWQRNTTFAPTTVRMLTADRWGIAAGAGTLTSVQRAAPMGVVRGMNGLQLTGNPGVTVVDISQRIEAINANVLRAAPPYITFSAQLFNSTGAAFTPTLFVDTPNALDTWTTSAVQNNAGAGDTLQSCPGGLLSTITWSADIGAYANLANGLGFRLRIPSGALDNNTKSVNLYDVQVEPVTAVGAAPSLFEVETFSDELARCQRYYFKTFAYGTVPVNNAGQVGALAFTQVVAAAASQSGQALRYPVTMRVAPAAVLFNPLAANAQIRNPTASLDWTISAVGGASSDSQVQVTGTAAAGSVAGQTAVVHITADAEL
jgi:hypothetical protein